MPPVRRVVALCTRPPGPLSLRGEKESMQAVQHTLLQTRHAGTDETGDALFRSPDADLRSLGGNQASVGIDMVGSEND